MIRAATQPGFDALAQALANMAAALATARARSRGGGDAVWRDAARLWPLFGVKG